MTSDAIKVVVVGDGAVGKTCLLIRYSSDVFAEVYIPTVFDNFSVDVMRNNRVVKLNLWDTAGQEEYDRLRQMAYDQTNVFLVCFALNSTTSLDNVKQKWIPEIRQNCPKTPFILVGTKKDIRDDNQNTLHIDYKDGLAMAKSIGAASFIECSSKNGEGVRAVFEQSIRASLQPL